MLTMFYPASHVQIDSMQGAPSTRAPRSTRTTSARQQGRDKLGIRCYEAVAELVEALLCCGALFIWYRAIHFLAGATETSIECTIASMLCHAIGLSTFYRCKSYHTSSQAAPTTTTDSLSSAEDATLYSSSFPTPAGNPIHLPKSIYQTPESPQVNEELYYTSCPICLTEWKSGDEVVIGQVCRHTVHGSCIDQWTAHSSHSNCPCCRQQLLDSSSFDPEQQPSSP
jgi:hypothetical protein